MEMLHKKAPCYLVILLSFLLLSCDSKLRYEHFEKVDEKAWDYKKTLRFLVPVEQAESASLTVALRNTTAYQNANLWLFVALRSPSGEVQRDTLNCLLADEYGYWLGSGFSGLYFTEHKLPRTVVFDEIGEWEVSITQGMRQDTLQGITDVGILVRKQAK